MILTANVDCAGCGAVYEGRWQAPADDVQDLDEAPRARQQCPACRREQDEAYPGWVVHTEAG